MCCLGVKKRKRTQQKTHKSSLKHTGKEKEEVDYYAQKNILTFVMLYLRVVDRLRCLFANLDDAQLVSWHTSDEHKDDGKLWHPAMASSGKISIKTTRTLQGNQGMLGLH